MAFHRGPKIVTDGLVLALDAANVKSYPGSGTTINDLSGNGNNGTLVNEVGYSIDTVGTLFFDGSNDYIDCGDNSITKPTGNMSISYWFKGISSSTNISGIGTMGSNRGYLLGPDNSSRIMFYVPSSASSLTSVEYNLVINPNLWYNLVGVYSPSTYIKIYLNGVNVATNTISVPSSLYTDNGVSLKLGQRGDGSYFNGNISSFLLYHKTLTSDEVEQNFNSKKSRFGL